MGAVRVRPLAPADAGAARAVVEAVVGESPPGLVAALADPAGLGLVAVAAGRLVGLAHVRSSPVHPLYPRLRIAVAPAFQGQGIGRRLLAALEAALRSPTGLQTVAAPDAAAPRRFLEASGFRPIRRTFTPTVDPRRLGPCAFDAGRPVPARFGLVRPLAEVAAGVAARRALGRLAHAIYARAHGRDPVAALPAAFWETAVFGPDLDVAGSLVLVDRQGPAALALMHHATGSAARALGWRGVANRRLAEAQAVVISLSARQIAHARVLGVDRLTAEVDDWDAPAMAMLGPLTFPAVIPAVTWRRDGPAARRFAAAPGRAEEPGTPT